MAIAPYKLEKMIVEAIARSPIQRLVAFNQERGWRILRFVEMLAVITRATM